MVRVFHPYWDWEDFNNGMYDTDRFSQQLIDDAIFLLSSPDLFYHTAIQMISEWKVSAKENLTNNRTNRKSWIGQASCCWLCKTPETLTRIAWGGLSTHHQIAANNVAMQVIHLYENQNRGIH